jgi:hypothetical protein
MRPAMVFALSVCFVSLSSPRHAFGQSTSHPDPRPFLSPSPFESPAGSKPSTLTFEFDLADRQDKILHELENRAAPVNPFRELPKDRKPIVAVQRSPRASECAHILIYQARDVDPKMIIKAPEVSVQNGPQAYGLPACRAEIYTAGDRRAAVPPETGRR